jgi:protoheme IX farnesyltransferase
LSTFTGILLELIKIRVTAAVSLTAAFGFLLASPGLSLDLLWVVLGLWLQAAGGASLNHWQERDTDARMARTRGRPLPAGRVTPDTVLLLAFLLLLAGTLLLWLVFGLPAAIAGLLSFVCYNLLYTPLKRRSHLAVLPGSLSGALPPFVGWLAGGGTLEQPLIWFVAAFLFIWQFPHFWILLILLGEEYHRAGLKTLASHMDRTQLRRLSRNWVFLLVLAGSSFMAPRFQLGAPELLLLVLGSVGLLLAGALGMGRDPSDREARRLFLWVNAYAFLVLACLCGSGWRGPPPDPGTGIVQARVVAAPDPARQPTR